MDTKIPTLTQTVDLLLLNGQRMCIDVKDNDYKVRSGAVNFACTELVAYLRTYVGTQFYTLLK